MYDVDVATALAMQVETDKKIDRFTVTKQQALIMHCDLCGRSHESQEYHVVKSMGMPNKHVDYMGNAPLT